MVTENLFYNENCGGSPGSTILYDSVETGSCITKSKNVWSSGIAVKFSCANMWNLKVKMYFRNNVNVSETSQACEGNPGLTDTFASGACYKSQIQPGRSMKYDFDSCWLHTTDGKLLFSSLIIGFVLLTALIIYFKKYSKSPSNRNVRNANVIDVPLRVDEEPYNFQ